MRIYINCPDKNIRNILDSAYHKFIDLHDCYDRIHLRNVLKKSDMVIMREATKGYVKNVLHNLGIIYGNVEIFKDITQALTTIIINESVDYRLIVCRRSDFYNVFMV